MALALFFLCLRRTMISAKFPPDASFETETENMIKESERSYMLFVIYSCVGSVCV